MRRSKFTSHLSLSKLTGYPSRDGHPYRACSHSRRRPCCRCSHPHFIHSTMCKSLVRECIHAPAVQTRSYPAWEPGPPSRGTSHRGKVGVSIHSNTTCNSKLKDYVLDAYPRRTVPTWLSCTRLTLRDGAACWQPKYHGSLPYAPSLAMLSYVSFFLIVLSLDSGWQKRAHLT